MLVNDRMKAQLGTRQRETVDPGKTCHQLDSISYIFSKSMQILLEADTETAVGVQVVN